MKKYMLLKIKPGKREKWLAWCNELETKHKEEVLTTLREERLMHEQCIVFGEGDNSYVAYKHVPISGEVKLPANMDRELNRKHFELFKECLEKVDGESIIAYDFLVDDIDS